MKEIVKRIPLIGPMMQRANRALHGAYYKLQSFDGSATYWEQRYAAGGNSGDGSYARHAEFKAEILNGFVARHGIQSVIEFGCGDGNQLRLANYPSYLGVDISPTAVEMCRQSFAGDPARAFVVAGDYAGQTADLAMSLDVIYHLVEDAVFERYMQTLFDAANRYVIVYSSDTDDNDGKAKHVRHRKFSRWAATHMPQWTLREFIPNKYPYNAEDDTGSLADFFIYEKS